MTKPASDFNRYPFWAPRFWGGMRCRGWWRLLRHNKYRFDWSRFPHVMIITLEALVNSVLARLQELVYGRRIDTESLVAPPIFIIGHWRSGTTYLHELLGQDPRFASPTTFQVYAANHFLLTEPIVLRFFNFLLPSKRPMDNVTMTWNSPQEDEWAMSTLGFPTPYQRVAFPNNPPPYLEYMDMEGLTDQEISAWSLGLKRFLQSVTLRLKKRLVSKSPHHTGRIHVLRKTFPDAKFIHVTRDPCDLVPSTVRMYQAFDLSQALQNPNYNGHQQDHGLDDCHDLEEYVLQMGAKMYQSFHRHRADLPHSQIFDVKYHELTADPVGTLAKIYEQLDLGDFSVARAAVQAFADSKRSYRRNRHELSDRTRNRIARMWPDYIERYNYPLHVGPGEP